MLTQKRFAIAVIMLLLFDAVAFLSLALTPGGRAVLRTAYVFAEVLPGVPSTPVGWVSEDYVVENLEISVRGTTVPLRTFRPADNAKRPALIMALGVTADYEDATLYKLSSALASTGVVVLIPESRLLANGHLFAGEVDSLVRSFEYLRGQPYIDTERVGFAGFSVGASLSVLAAADERIKNDVALVNFFGGYVELSDYAAAIISNQLYDDGELVGWNSNPTPRRVLQQNMIRLVRDPAERQLLTDALESGSLTPNVSPETIATYRYLQSGTYDDAKLNEQSLSDSQKQLLSELSVNEELQTLSADVFVLVDKKDRMVPYVESKKAARIAEQRLVKFSQISGLEHVRPKNFVSIVRFPADFIKLARHMHQMLDSL